jgi:hypothetical protein
MTTTSETDEQIGKLGNRLGELVEWQIRPSAVALFKERGKYCDFK